LSGYIKPTRLAVGAKAGAEVFAHALRQWCFRNKDDVHTVLLKRDYSNAFNEADEHEFLSVTYEKMPGCARLAEWCYGEPVNLVYHGKIIKSYKGQQGCPLMMPMYCAMRKKVRELTPAAEGLSFQADYADDGMDGGMPHVVLATLMQEMAVAKQYGMHFNFSKMKLYLMAGDRFQGDISGLEQLGIQIDRSQNILFMKAPVMGTTDFLQSFANEKMRELDEILTTLSKLPNPHVAYYLLKKCSRRLQNIISDANNTQKYDRQPFDQI
jgi:hypothetical protein